MLPMCDIYTSRPVAALQGIHGISLHQLRLQCGQYKYIRKDGTNTMDENTQAKFDEKIKELLNLAKKKKNVLEYQEISEFFADMPLEEEQFEKILEILEQNTVDVLRITEDDVDDEGIILTDEDLSLIPN